MFVIVTDLLCVLNYLKNAGVRKASLLALRKLYEMDENVPTLGLFTERFSNRMIEMADDVDMPAAVCAIGLVKQLLRYSPSRFFSPPRRHHIYAEMPWVKTWAFSGAQAPADTWWWPWPFVWSAYRSTSRNQTCDRRVSVWPLDRTEV